MSTGGALTSGTVGRSARKHAAIVSAAKATFLREGFGGTSMDVIATESGVSKQTIYAHFGSKEALFAATVAELTAQIARQLPGLPDRGLDRLGVEAWLFDYAVRQLRGVLTPEIVQLRRLVIAEADRSPAMARAFYDNGVQRSIDLLTAALENFVADGVLSVDDPAAAAHDFNWLLMGRPVNQAMMLGSSSTPGPRQLRTHARRAVTVFLAAYDHGR